MGTSISKESNDVEVLDAFSFRIIITFLCLKRRKIPYDIIDEILKIMNLIYGLDIIQEAKYYGWKMIDNGKVWEFKSAVNSKKYIDVPVFSYNVIDDIKLPKYLYVKSFRRTGESKCLICDKNHYAYYRLHNIVLCGDKCRKIYESTLNCRLWIPYYK